MLCQDGLDVVTALVHVLACRTGPAQGREEARKHSRYGLVPIPLRQYKHVIYRSKQGIPTPTCQTHKPHFVGLRYAPVLALMMDQERAPYAYSALYDACVLYDSEVLYPPLTPDRGSTVRRPSSLSYASRIVQL